MLRSCWDHYCHRWQHCDKYVFFAFLKVFIDLKRNKKNMCISFEYSKRAIFIMSIFNVTSSDTNILDCMFLLFHINESQIIKRSVKRWFFVCLLVFKQRYLQQCPHMEIDHPPQTSDHIHKSEGQTSENFQRGDI